MQQQIIFHRKSISRNITHPQPYKSYYNIYLNKIVGLKQQKMLGENLIDWETNWQIKSITKSFSCNCPMCWETAAKNRCWSIAEQNILELVLVILKYEYEQKFSDGCLSTKVYVYGFRPSDTNREVNTSLSST